MMFVCPKCKKKLNISGASASCAEGHSYDKARGGYYNLLLSNTGGVHGDNKEMVLARRAFLGEGHYKPLAEKIAETILAVTECAPTLLDAGCGEGYYTDFVERALFARDGESHISAFDISKDAVREVAKKNPRISLAVAGSYHMPLPDAAFDIVLNTFSPLALIETRRVLHPGGVFVMAIPAEEHLFELKSAIYDTPYKNIVEDTALEGLEIISDIPVRYTMNLSGAESIRSLFMMTPYAYRTKRENAERVLALTGLECTADFRVLAYKKL